MMKKNNSLIILIILLVGLFSISSQVLAVDVSSIVDDHSITMMSTSLNIEYTTRWRPYDSNDAPEGAYMGWMYAGEASLTGTVTLPQVLQPGRYYIFFKGISYDSNLTVSASIGGGVSTSVVADDSDDDNGNKYWTDGAVIDVATASDTLDITLHKAGVLSGVEKLLLRGMYITSDAEETVNRDDIVVKLTYPTEMDDSDPVKGNLISNGGMEAGGLDTTWGFASNKAVNSSALWDNTEAYDGEASLKIPIGLSTNLSTEHSTTLYSRVYHLKPNKKYTLSMWMKASSSASVTASISLLNTFTPPAAVSHGQYSISSSSLPLTSTWARYSITGYLLEYPTSDYQIRIMNNADNNGFIWMDNVQLEEGELTDFEPSSAMEVGLNIDQPGNIYYTDESITADLIVRNNATTSASGIVHYEIYDYLNNLVQEDETSPITVSAESTETVSSFDLSTGKQGIFRIVYWVEDNPNSERETVYSIIPRPAVAGLDADSYMGIHPNYLESQLTTLQKLGIKWSRVMSPSGFFRWSVVEPVDDQFVWYDEEMDLASSTGISTMGTLGTNNYWPAWADNNGLPDLVKWREFVSQIVTHYKPWINDWEVWNEPVAFTPDFYAQMLKEATDAIKAADPDARIIGMGGLQLEDLSNPTYVRMKSVISSIEARYPTWDWKNDIEVLSTHVYPGGNLEQFKEGIIDLYSASGTKVWNTETGIWDLGFYQSKNSNFVSWGKNLWPHADATRFYIGAVGAPTTLVENFLRSIASGMTKYFYYDSRIFAAPDYFLGHPTIMEYDGTVRTKGIAYAVAGSFVDHSTGLGDLGIDLNTFALLFDKGNSSVVSLFSKDNTNMQLTLPLTHHTQYEVYDLMGNEMSVSGNVIPYGRMPIYVQAVNISSTTLATAFLSAATSTATDNLDPNLSISDGPRGLIYDKDFRFRWIGLDDTSLPNLGEISPESNSAIDDPAPEALLYRYQLKLNGASDDWSTWSPRTYIDYTDVVNGLYTFYVQVQDKAENVSEISRELQVGTDFTAPSVTAFTIPATASSLTIAISTFTATDTVAVTGYLINEASSTPAVDDTDWSASAQTSYTFSSAGTKTLYAWAKDAGGNISTSTSASIVITISSGGGGGGGGGGSGPTTPPATTTATTTATSTSTIPLLPLLISTSSASTSTATGFTFTRILNPGYTGEDVRQLQIYLNTHGFIISPTGVGSPGHETNYFGEGTRLALIRFQEAHRAEILTPAGFTRGTGIFGLGTMKYINQQIRGGGSSSSTSISICQFINILSLVNIITAEKAAYVKVLFRCQ